MAHPYRSAAHKNDPKWINNLNKYVVPEATDEDVTAVIRNYGGDAQATAKAAYAKPEKR